MFDSRVFDVVLGLAAVYGLLALGCSWIGEWVSSMLQLRASTLERAIGEFLASKATQDPKGASKPVFGPAELFAHALVAPLSRRGKGGATGRPSHVPCWILARAVWDLAVPSEGNDPDADLSKVVDGIPIDAVRAIVASSLAEGRTKASEVRADLETYFESQLDRARGWYARNMQKVVVIIAVVTTLALNVNSAAIAESLWNDDAARAAMVEAAGELARDAAPPPPETSPAANPATGPATGPAAGTDTSSETSADPRTAHAEALVRLVDLPVPLGWTWDARAGSRSLSVWDWATVFHRLAGWLTTIIALSLGAPFWFGALDKLIGLRLGGARSASSPRRTERTET
jgi:hypothetical protein